MERMTPEYLRNPPLLYNKRPEQQGFDENDASPRLASKTYFEGFKAQTYDVPSGTVYSNVGEGFGDEDFSAKLNKKIELANQQNLSVQLAEMQKTLADSDGRIPLLRGVDSQRVL